MCGGTGPIFRILEMVTYLGTVRNLLKMSLATPVSVSNKAQKNLGDYTHTIDSTRSMHTMM